VIEDPEDPSVIGLRIALAWPGASLVGEPTPLTGGFWAAMYRLRLEGQPRAVPSDLVFRMAPDTAMGAKEVAVQQSVAELGFPTPSVRLSGRADDDLAGTWSVMDFAAGTPPLGDLNGLNALRRAPRLLTRIPSDLATAMAGLHGLDPDPVSSAVEAAAPGVAWRVGELFEQFETGAEALGRRDLVCAVRALADRQPVAGTTVICHGDLHPFNLLVDERGPVTVIDWTAAIRAAPAYDLAFTALLLANPPLDAPRPLNTVIRSVGARMARAFIARYRALCPHSDLGTLDWYRALHGARILIDAASQEACHGPGVGRHPFASLVPAATAAVNAATGSPIISQT
jgi:aminoglycoside phosphotransferase (APT) family kinase protein